MRRQATILFLSMRLAVLLAMQADLTYSSVALSAGSLGVGLVIRKTGRFYWASLASAAITLPTLITMTLMSERTPKFFVSSKGLS